MAEPSRPHLTQLMRRVFEQRDEARHRGERARRDIVEKWGWERAVDAVLDRLEAISAQLGVPAVSAAGDSDGKQAPVRVRWEGSQFVTHSLAHVNRELSLKLLAAEDVDLSLVP